MDLLWLFTVFLGIIIVAVFGFMLIFQKCKVIESVSIQQKINFIKKISPLCHTKGWSIYGVNNGLRIWQKNVGSAISHWYTGSVIYGCSCVVSTSLKDILNALQDLRYIAEWDPCMHNMSRISAGTGHDVISGTPVSMTTTDHLTLEFLKMLGRNTKSIYSRYWNSSDGEEGWFFSSAMQKSLFTSGFSWGAVVITPIVTEITAKPSLFEINLITAPSRSYSSMYGLKLITSIRLAGLRDFLTFSYPGKMVNRQSGVAPNCNVIQESSENNETNATIEKMSEEDEPKQIPFHVDESEITVPEGKEKKYLEDNIKQMQKLCMEAYNASVGTDGWSFLANVKNVEITKRSAQSGEPPWDTLKGTVTVNVPVHYALAYGFDLQYRGEWDDLYARGETVKEFNPLTKILHTEFKAIWPTSGRDFTNLVALREIEDGLYCIAGGSAGECPECPPKRGLVRGDLLVMGFFVKEISSDPPCCQITYISRADLKGNLPPRLVNRVTQSQPQGLAVLRDRLEVLYNRDKEQGSDSDQMSEIQKQGVDLWVELMKIRELKESGILDVPVVKTLKESPGSNRKRLHKFKQDSLDSQSTADEKSLKEDSLIKEEKVESTLEKSSAEVNDENVKLPFVDTSQVDYKTLGNQAAATVLGEVVLASKAEIGSDNLNDPNKNKGEWTYQSIEKDVVILRKISPGEKIHSFLGKGLIKCSPTVVFDAVRNHMTRHVYDKMLKRTQLIREIDEHAKLQYLHFEAAQCFLKQARDFLVLTVERVEPERFAVAGVSVDAPECPPLKNMIRGKVYGSGFVIEPVLQDGRLYSMVSYLSQVDFGGMIPVRLLNYVARRQPLCIAYLREYLEKFKN